MSYEIIEKNKYGVLVKNTTNYGDCFFCKYEITQCNNRYKCINDSYYLPDQEAEKHESENPLMNTTIDDLYIESKCYFEVKKKLDDTQKELIDLQNENKQLKERVNELETTIENNVTELIHRTGDLTHDFWYFCSECLENFEMDENFNYCPSCGRKIIRK